MYRRVQRQRASNDVRNDAEMLQSTPSLGQLVDSIHSGLDVDRLRMVYVGFSMKDARELCEDATAEAHARTPGQVPADLQRGDTRSWMGTSNHKASDYSRSYRSGYEEGSSAEYKHDCNRKSYGVPIAIDNADHVSSSTVEFEETVLHERHSGYIQAPQRRVVLRQTDPWHGLPLRAAVR